MTPYAAALRLSTLRGITRSVCMKYVMANINNECFSQ
jgi:hypothetical protein